MHNDARTRRRFRSHRAAAALIALAMLASACTPSAPESGVTPESTIGTPVGQGTTTVGDQSSTVTTTTVVGDTSAPTPPANNGRVSGAGSSFISLDDPVMVPASSATWLDPDDVVLGIVTPNGTAEAFPIRQMAYHHIANTTIDGEPYLVTY